MKKIALVTFFLSTAYLICLSFTTHALRASFVKIVDVSPDFLLLPPSDIENIIHFEDRSILSGLNIYLDDARHDLRRFTPVEIMQWIGSVYHEKTKSNKTWMPESPAREIESLVIRGERGSCYNDSILFGTIAQAMGSKVRYVTFNSSDGLGGRGHTVAEVWMEEYGKWILFDQQQVAIFLNASDKLPMSAYEVRKKVLTSSKTQFNHDVVIIQGTGFRIPKENIWNLYQTSNSMHILGSADYFTRIQRNTANKFADWLEAGLEPYGRTLLIGRFFRAFFGEVPRLRVVDEFSPGLGYAFWYYAFRISLLLWLASLLIIVSVFIKNQFGKAQQQSRSLSVPTSTLLDRR